MTDPRAGDYLITAVHYNPQQTHIEAAEVLIDDGQSIGNPTDLTRERIITMLGEGHRFITVQLKGRDWQRTAAVKAVTTDSNIWIRADTHRIDADDLGALPGYEPHLARLNVAEAGSLARLELENRMLVAQAR